MKRTVLINIGGKDYPMRFSIGAAKAISEKYGDLEKMVDNLSSSVGADSIDTIIWIVELLIKHGCAYKNMFEKNEPIPEGAPVENGIYIPATQEEIEIGTDLQGFEEIKNKIYETIQGGKKQEIEVETKDKKKKNVETT